MAQYIEFTDGTDTFRMGVRDQSYVIDKELNDNPGFDGGIENVDWTMVRTIKPQP